MVKLSLLAMVIIIKILIAKGIALASIILSVWFKDRQLRYSTMQWDQYFLSLKELFIILYIKTIYIISTILSACLMFVLCELLQFRYPMFLTVIVEAVCIFSS